MDVLCFGEALLDFFPERPGQLLEDCERFTRHLGGAPCNVAVVLARLGVAVGLQTLVGKDAFGVFVRRQLAEEGVDVRGVGVHPTAKTGVTFVSVASDGKRGFLFFRHPSADQMISVAEVDRALIGAARVFHLGSSTLAKEPSRAATFAALDLAKAEGRIISCDPNWRGHLWDEPASPHLERLVSACDILKVSDDEVETLCGTTDLTEGATRLRALGCRLVVITLGARGCLFFSEAGDGEVPGRPVSVVDTTGAGDAFMAGLLAALPTSPSDWNVDAVLKACTTANFYGAEACTALGATTGISRRLR